MKKTYNWRNELKNSIGSKKFDSDHELDQYRLIMLSKIADKYETLLNFYQDMLSNNNNNNPDSYVCPSESIPIPAKIVHIKRR